MPKITFLDPEDTGTVTWRGKTFGPNKAVSVDAQADAELIAAASGSPGFWRVTGLDGDAQEAADAAKAEADEMAAREKAALQAEDDAAQEAAEAEREASEAVTQPGATEKAQQAGQQAVAQTKKPGGR